MDAMLEAAQSGDTRRALETLRDELASAFDLAPPTVCAQIAAQYRATLADLAALAPVKMTSTIPGVVTLDDAKAKRAARQSAATAAPATKPSRRKRG